MKISSFLNYVFPVLRPGLHDTGLLFASDWFRQNHVVFIAVTRHRIDMNPLLIAVTRH